MILDGRTLILVADGRRARLFEEARRGGPLTERTDWIAPPLAGPAGWRGGAHDAAAHAPRATSHPDGRDKAETDFLVQLSRRIEVVFAEQAFDRLILIAAPRALGVLRRHLPGGLKAQLELSEPHDRLSASADDIQLAVRALRRVNA